MLEERGRVWGWGGRGREGAGPTAGWGRRGGGGQVGAYLDRRQSCCRVSARAAAHYTGCCRRRIHRNEYDSASPPHMWQNTHSTLTTPPLTLSLRGWRLRTEGDRGGEGKG